MQYLRITYDQRAHHILTADPSDVECGDARDRRRSRSRAAHAQRRDRAGPRRGCARDHSGGLRRSDRRGRTRRTLRHRGARPRRPSRPARWLCRSSRRSPPRSPRRTRRRPATCIGAPPARISSTPRWCSNCGGAIDALIEDLNRAIDALRGADRQASPHRVGRPYVAAARRADAVRAQACRLCGGACALARAAEAPAQGGAGAAIRRRRRHARGARRSRASTSPSGWPPCSTCRCRTRPGTPTATGLPSSPQPLPSLPAPAARSPATSRC